MNFETNWEALRLRTKVFDQRLVMMMMMVMVTMVMVMVMVMTMMSSFRLKILKVLVIWPLIFK